MTDELGRCAPLHHRVGPGPAPPPPGPRGRSGRHGRVVRMAATSPEPRALPVSTGDGPAGDTALPGDFRQAIRAEMSRVLHPPFETLLTVAINAALMSSAWFFLPPPLFNDLFSLHGSLAFAFVLSSWMYSDVPATNVLASDSIRVLGAMDRPEVLRRLLLAKATVLWASWPRSAWWSPSSWEQGPRTGSPRCTPPSPSGSSPSACWRCRRGSASSSPTTRSHSATAGASAAGGSRCWCAGGRSSSSPTRSCLPSPPSSSSLRSSSGDSPRQTG